MIVAIKKCAVCRKKKVLSEFHKRSASADGLARVCKQCERERRLARYWKDPEARKKASQVWRDQNRTRVRAGVVSYRQRLRLEAINYYSKGKNCCSCCGEDEIKFLTMDHSDGGGKEHRRKLGKTPIVVWLKKNDFPSGFEILCFNCNCAKGAYGICPHKASS